jgi:hypothetical protein
VSNSALPITTFTFLRSCLALSFTVFILGSTVQAKESAEFADKVIAAHALTPTQGAALKKILTQTPGITRNIGTEDPTQLQGPNNSWHPATRAQCIAKVITTGLIQPNKDNESKCGAKWMAPVLEYPGQPASAAKVCIDQFAFPNMPCEYPVVWSPAPVTKSICAAMGKRVCNSHEWEGACAGSMEHDPYLFELSSLDQRRSVHNQNRDRVFAFQWQSGLAKQADTRVVCGVYAANDPEISSPMKENPSKYYSAIGKSTTCQNGKASDYETCGTNTWPSGFKFDCRSQQGVFDMHGNVAEVVNFPTSEKGIAHGSVTDKTERKGSFFVKRDQYPDDCRVRQPYEHFHDFDTDQMAYYQEGFRCCKDVE